MNPRNLIKQLLLLCLLIPGIANAVTEADFEVKTTKNLLNLCTASAEDPQYQQAIHFCYGYLVGAYHYYEAENNGPGDQQLVCPPKPEPTRNETIKKVVSWFQQHPEYMHEIPVETEFRALTDLWPCKK